MLFIGEEVGTGKGPAVDIAVAPLEGTTICAKNLPNSISVVAVAAADSLLKAPPDVYMDKIAIGPGYKEGLVDLDAERTRLDKEIAKVAAEKDKSEAKLAKFGDNVPPAVVEQERARLQDWSAKLEALSAQRARLA